MSACAQKLELNWRTGRGISKSMLSGYYWPIRELRDRIEARMTVFTIAGRRHLHPGTSRLAVHPLRTRKPEVLRSSCLSRT